MSRADKSRVAPEAAMRARDVSRPRADDSEEIPGSDKRRLPSEHSEGDEAEKQHAGEQR